MLADNFTLDFIHFWENIQGDCQVKQYGGYVGLIFRELVSQCIFAAQGICERAYACPLLLKTQKLGVFKSIGWQAIFDIYGISELCMLCFDTKQHNKSVGLYRWQAIVRDNQLLYTVRCGQLFFFSLSSKVLYFIPCMLVIGNFQIYNVYFIFF